MDHTERNYATRNPTFYGNQRFLKAETIGFQPVHLVIVGPYDEEAPGFTRPEWIYTSMIQSGLVRLFMSVDTNS